MLPIADCIPDLDLGLDGRGADISERAGVSPVSGKVSICGSTAKLALQSFGVVILDGDDTDQGQDRPARLDDLPIGGTPGTRPHGPRTGIRSFANLMSAIPLQE